MKPNLHRRLRHGTGLLLALIPFVFFGCGEPTPERIDITPQSREMAVGETVEFSATVLNSDGEAMPDQPISWQATGEAGRIDGTGTFSARQPGEAEITATSGELSAAASVTVTPAALSDLEISPAEPGGQIGEELTLTIAGKDADDQPAGYHTVSISTPTENLSLAAEEATLDENGSAEIALTLPPTPGEAEVRLTVGEMEKTVAIQVDPRPIADLSVSPETSRALAGAEVPVTIQATDADGEPAGFHELTLEPADDAIAVSEDRVTLDAEGTAQFTVTLSSSPGANAVALRIPGEEDARATLEIAGAPVSRLTISPREDAFAIGQQVEFTATGHDEFGNSRPVDPEWSLSQPVATVSEDGKATMKSLGEGILFARYQGVQAAQPFSVVPGEPAEVRIEPKELKAAAGERVNFSGTVFNAYEQPLSVSIQWETEGGIGEISGEGAFVAQTAGTGQVVARSGDAQAEVPVTVGHGELHEIDFSLEKSVIPAGETVELSARGMDAFGNRFPIRPEWLLSTSIGEVEQEENRFRALRAGAGEIIAKVGEVLRGARVEVVPGSLSRLEMKPQSANLIAGETVEFAVEGFDRFDNLISVEPEFSLSREIGELAPDGTLTVETAGNAVVTAKVEDFSSESTVAVAPAEMETARIVPEGPIGLTAGDAQALKVSGFDAYGNTVTSRVQWGIRPALGRITENGVLHPEKAGKGTVMATVTQPRTGRTLEVATPFSVAPGQTARIEVQPEAAELVAGESVQFTAASFDRFDNRTEAEIDWKLGPPELGEIDDTGRFSGVRAETGQVSAVHGNVEGTAAVAVVPAEVAFLKIIPESIDIRAGEQVSLDAIIEDRFGNEIPGRALWQLSPDSLGTIEDAAEDAALAGQKAGEGKLVATFEDRVATAPVTVSPGPLHAIELTPAGAEVAAGSTLEFTAKGYDPGGNPVSAEVEWSLSEPVGKLDDGGTLEAEKTGAAEVQARAGDVSATVSVEVVPGEPAEIRLSETELELTAGETHAFSFEVFDGQGNRIPDPGYRWEVPDDRGVFSADNQFTAKRAGEGPVRLVAGPVTETISVTVNPGDIARVEVAPAERNLRAGDTRPFTASGFDAQDNPLEISPVWSVDGGVGTIQESGEFQATRVGDGFVVARMDSASGVARISVEPGPVDRVEISPDSVEIAAGEVARLSATAFDAFDNPTPAAVSWSLSDAAEAGGELTGPGTFQARTVGSGHILAAAEGVSGRVPVEISHGPLRELSFRREAAELRAGERTELQVSGRDAFGNDVPVEPNLTVFPETLGEIGADGSTFEARGVGSGRIEARFGTVTADLAVAVRPGEPTSIEVQLPAGSLMAGKTYSLQAIGYDPGGNPVPISAEWAASPEVGRIESDTGLFHARKAGTGLVVAYGDGVKAAKTVEVQPGDLYKLFLSPNPVTVASATVQEFTASGYDVEENEVPLSESAVEWETAGDIGQMEAPGEFLGTRMGKGKVIARTGDLLAESYVTVIPGQPVLANSRIRVTHPALPADGNAFSEVIVEVRDRHHNPVPEISVTLVSSRQGDEVVQPGPTGEDGQARGRVLSTEAGDSVIRAVIDGRSFPDTARVTFE
ncbi:MAG: Ig-like domain-containing protein [Desulfococcaceae bacterium]